MKPVRTFEDLRLRVQDFGPVRLAVAGGNDPQVLQTIVEAMKLGLVRQALVTGDPGIIGQSIPRSLKSKVEVIGAENATDCASHAVRAVRAGTADVLMKGHIDSTSYLRAVVNRDTGIRKASILSNVTVAQMPSCPKLIVATDNGIIPAPDLTQKRQIILNTRILFHGLGVEPVKVAAVAATEKVSSALQSTTDASTLAEESRRGGFPGFVVDGPFGYDVAVSADAARIKKMDKSPVAGQADLLLFPTIDAANAVAKAWKFHGQAETGSLVLGASVPVLLNSRSDSEKRRIIGLMLAILAAKSHENNGVPRR
jgi:phosphate butyryltransferase